jgi:putative VirB-like lipoprotein
VTVVRLGSFSTVNANMKQVISAFVIAVLLAGCSFALVSGPPDHHEQLPYVSCTESRLAPILDSIFTALQVANSIFAIAASDSTWHDTFCDKNDSSCSPALGQTTAIPIYIGLAAVGAAGMYYGFSRTGECRAAREEQMARAAQQSNQPAPLPGWPPPPAPGATAPAAPYVPPPAATP